MPFREPRWWYRSEPGIAAASLTAVAAIYGAIAERRLKRSPDFHCSLPVVCIGNFTAGGTGKTPLALFLAKALQAKGLSPVFLTRGYGSSVRSPLFVDPSRHSASDVGDEALLLCQIAPVMVSPDRVAGAQAIAEANVQADLILMDDGLQNPSLAKDLCLAVVDGARGFGNERVIPSGPLRAPLCAQLTVTDVVVVNGTGAQRDCIAEIVRPCFSGPVVAAAMRPRDDAGWLRGRDVIAYAGIGNPERFFRMLEDFGSRLVERHVFADHHAYSEDDARQLDAAARRSGAVLVSTEKDLVRLRGQSGARGELATRTHSIGVEMQMTDEDETTVMERVLQLCVTPRQQ